MSPNIVVKKYGGTSVGSIERIESLADRLVRDIASGQKPIVVASAMSGDWKPTTVVFHKMVRDATMVATTTTAGGQ
ncbi:MAG: hypothetical protein AAB250_18950 [Bdellovibrionota bacterium]